jgi:methionyl aminopeptidase
VVQNRQDIEAMREAGRIVATVLRRIREAVAPGVTTKELDQIAIDSLAEMGAKSAFYGYNVGHGPYPGNICASINEVVVHGIPSERKLEEGDIIAIDFGAEKGGLFADSAITVAVGKIDAESERLMAVTQEALGKGIEQARAGNRITDVSRAIQTYVESHGYSLADDLYGHGIGRRMHEPPNIPNIVMAGKGALIEVGMGLAIEPMVNMGRSVTRTLRDGWTVVARDGKRSGHFEHTVLVGESGPEIMTVE